MHVIKRNGKKEPVYFDKITERIKNLSWNLSPVIEPVSITNKVISQIYNNIPTAKLDELAAETAASLITYHPDYGTLAARLEISNLHKMTEKSFGNVMKKMMNNTNMETNEPSPMISERIMKIVNKHSEKLDNAIDFKRDYSYDYFGIKTLIKSYLTKINGVVIERPQHLLMRVSVGIHLDDIDAVIETYTLLSKKYFIHASPTLFNAASPKPQMSSCFLLTMKGDSIEDIYDTLKQCATISKHAGGIGLSVHNVRGKGSYIKGTNGKSNGLVPMLRVFNDTARYVDQGGGKRKGSFAVYLEPWHCDIFDFLSLKKNHGKPEERCRDLFFALWIPDLFMQRVYEDGFWCLMCPDRCKGLQDVYGEEFDKSYKKYEEKKIYKRRIKARDLWSVICHSQMETGQPFMLYKDACNKKSNQKNLGTIKSSNLCTEIVEYSDENEIAVCNLASISLPKFVNLQKKTFDFDKLIKVTGVITRNLNKIIDLNFYPLPECKRSNLRHRPIGIGVQGLADVFILLRLPFDSHKAKQLNKHIFEAIYYGAVKASNELAIKHGPYESFEGSPASQGLLQFDLWGHDNEQFLNKKYKWKELKQSVKKHGLRNSLLTAPMPTASTSQILGNNECIEPYTSNVYIRRTLAGEFVVMNKHLLRDLIDLGIWNESLKDKLIANNGSVQDIDEIPSDLKKLYRNVWEIKQREIINMAADRGLFIDQSQSLNIHLREPNYGKMTSMHFHGWKLGLKTGMYYLRTKAAADAIKFTVPHTQTQSVHHRMRNQKTVRRKVVKIYDEEDEKEDINLTHNGHKIKTEMNGNHKTMPQRKLKTMTCDDDEKDCLMCGA